MAKSIVLYGVFLGAFICFCSYVSGVGVGSYRQSAVSHQPPAVILSGTKWSRKISPLTAKTVRPAEDNLIRNQIKKIYSAEIGVREKTGKNDGKRVEEYLAVTNLGKGYAWCASFVSWVFAEAGFPQPRTPWSPALFPKERVIWEREKGVLNEESGDRLNRPSTPVLIPNMSRLTPATADVFGIYYANLKRIAHAGFVDEWGDKYLITVEGVRP